MGQYSSNGTFFIDLDGTVFVHSTNEPLPGVLESLKWIKDNGYKIVFTTYRGDENFKGHEIYGKFNTEKTLQELNIEYDHIIFDLASPRILINDDSIGGLRVKSNIELTVEDVKKSIELSLYDEILNVIKS